MQITIFWQDCNYKDFFLPFVLDKIAENELFLFLPYEILRHIRNVKTEKNIIEYTNEIYDVYNKIIDMLKYAYNESKIRDAFSLL